MYGRVNYQYVLPPRLALTLTFANAGTKVMMISVVEVSSAWAVSPPDRNR